MKKVNLFKSSLYAVALGAVAAFGISCTKTNVNEPAAASQSDDQAAAGTRGGLFASAADTAAAVNNLYFFQSVSGQLQQTMQYATNAKDGNGVFYNYQTDEFYQVSRKNKTIYVFAGASTMGGTPAPSRTIVDTTLSSGREIAYDTKRDILYVANNSDSSIRVYRKFSTLSGSIKGDIVKIQGQPWGISYDRSNNRLIVAMDLTAMRLDIFDRPNDFVPGAAIASRSLNIADRPNGAFSRLHGVTYNSDDDILIVTEIGEAAAPIVPTPDKPAFNADGGIYIFKNAAAKLAAGGTMSADGLIYGDATGLGNPVDVDTRNIHGETFIYIAEKANKKIITFKVNPGNTIPVTALTTTYSPEAISLWR